MRKTIVGVTGGYGMVGSKVVKCLLCETPHYILVGRRNPNAEGGFPEERVSYMLVNVFTHSSLDVLCRPCLVLVSLATIATQMVAEGSVPSGYRWASQIPDVDLFMGRFLRQGYSISRTWQRRFNGAGKGAAA